MSASAMKPPYSTAILSYLWLSAVWLSGKFWDLFLRRHQQRKGYAPLKDGKEDFYIRRIYGRANEAFNRPLAGSPGAWVDVMMRRRVYVKGIAPEWHVTGETVKCLNLASYNYLGFGCTDPYCTPRVLDTLNTFGVSMCSARTEGGTTAVHQELEQLVAEFLGVEAAITYGMGYATNSATIPALVGRGCLILSDSLNHASIVTGARDSGAKIKVFRHNDPRHLEALLRTSIAEGQPRTHRPWKKILIIVEGIYSMEGEMPCLREIVALKRKYGAYLYLDEAHSIGALGATGRGCCEAQGVDIRDIDIMMGTFTKSYGSCGGYIAGSRQLVDHIRRTSPAHLYATAMSPAAVQQVISSFHVIMGRDGTDRGATKLAQLRDNAEYLRTRFIDMGLTVLSSPGSPVIPIMIFHLGKIPATSVFCLARRVAIVVVGAPATPLLEGRMRICVSAAHTRADLDYALDVLAECADTLMLRYNKHRVHRQPALAPAADHVAEAGEEAEVDGRTGGKGAAGRRANGRVEVLANGRALGARAGGWRTGGGALRAGA